MILVPNHRLLLSGNSRLISSLLVILIILSLSFQLTAQNEKSIKQSDVIENIDGRKYYIHEVKPGHTVYSIAEAYDISPKDIYNYNPEAKKVIEPSQMLKIPVSLVDGRELEPDEKEKEGASSKQKSFSEKKIKEHLVKEKETLYSLARKYNTSVSRLKELNPNTVDILEKGQKIKVPARKKRQSSTSSKEKISKNDSLILYEVEKGETLYRIAANHDISVDTIIKMNPGVADGLEAGTVIKLPRQKKSSEETDKTVKVKEDTSKNYIEHTVSEGETLYNLSMQYSISIDELKKHNPQLKDGLKAGQVLQIPVKSRQHEEEQFVFLKEKKLLDSLIYGRERDTMINCDSVAMKKSYNIALFVPLYLDKMESIKVSDYNEPGWPEKNIRSFSYIHFYEGFMQALDSLKKQGFKADVYVRDTKADTGVVKDLVNKPEFKSYDLIFGPFRDEALEMVVEKAKPHSINVVSPVSYAMSIVKGNDHLFKLFPPKNYQINRIMEYVADKHREDNLIFVHGSSKGQKQLKNKTQNVLNQKLGISDSARPYKTVISDTLAYKKVKDYLDKSKPNFIFCTHKGEVRINKLVNKLNGVRDDYEIVLFGSNAWESYSSIESKYLNNLKYTSFTEYLIDYSDVRVKKFVNIFTEKYKTWPNKMAFKGFDAAYYFLNGLYYYGEKFPYCLQNMDVFTMHNDFNFKQRKNNAWQNSKIIIYQYRNFKRENLTRNLIQQDTILKNTEYQNLLDE